MFEEERFVSSISHQKGTKIQSVKPKHERVQDEFMGFPPPKKKKPWNWEFNIETFFLFKQIANLTLLFFYPCSADLSTRQNELAALLGRVCLPTPEHDLKEWEEFERFVIKLVWHMIQKGRSTIHSPTMEEFTEWKGEWKYNRTHF